ncbi:MAG: large-conductance mechanosensitive channel protein MscL [Candidatus Gracilibacteria bacterium]|nr:large-conductance mechanosensitive channel protein MscL [Candidatus Gracilibacteria bacterium]
MQILKEFKEFAIRGSVIDLAVGVIIGGAFNSIVASLVGDVIMPLLSLLTRGIDFKELKFVIMAASDGLPEVAIRYGAFLQAALQFFIVAFAVFLLVKGINRLKREKKTK